VSLFVIPQIFSCSKIVFSVSEQVNYQLKWLLKIGGFTVMKSLLNKNTILHKKNVEALWLQTPPKFLPFLE